MRNTCINALADLADEGVPIHFLTADLGFKILDAFRERHPRAFTNVGVAEANMVSVAAGMATLGLRPVCYSMVPFLFMRAFEQVRIDVVAHGLPVILLGVGGGLSYGHEGTTHHAWEDLAMARALPGLRVVAPGDPHEARQAIRDAAVEAGPTYIRLGQNGDRVLHTAIPNSIREPIEVMKGDGRVLLVATGHILAEVVEAANRLAIGGMSVTLLSIPTLKPLAPETVAPWLKNTERVITIEEHSRIGGLGGFFAELICELGVTAKLTRIGLPDRYCETNGSLAWLRREYRLDASSLVDQIREVS